MYATSASVRSIKKARVPLSPTNNTASSVDAALTAVRTGEADICTRWSVTTQSGGYSLRVARSNGGGDWVAARESSDFQTLTAAVQHDPGLTQLPVGSHTAYEIHEDSALAFAAMLTCVSGEGQDPPDWTDNENAIGTINGNRIVFLPRPDTSERVAVLISECDEPLGVRVGFYRWADDYFPATVGTKWLVELAPGIAVAGGDGDFYTDLRIFVSNDSLTYYDSTDTWESGLAMDGDEWELAIENGDAEYSVSRGIQTFSLD